MEKNEADQDLVQRGLPMAVKRRIIELFATFQGLSAVQHAIASEFGLSLDQRTLANYDPSRAQCRVGSRLKELYRATRQAYVERSADVAIAHQAHRLRRLETIIDKAEKARDFSSALKGLEIAAKEMGGVLEGRTTIKHEGAIEHRHLSVEDARAELAMRLAHVIEGDVLRPATPSLPPPDPAPPTP